MARRPFRRTEAVRGARPRLVSRSRMLAFDEPLGAIDALTHISMQKLLERVWLDQKFTVDVTLADRG